MATAQQAITDDEEKKPAPGIYAPKEGTGDKDAPEELGENFEHLEELHPEIVSKLKELVFGFRTEGIVARRHEIRRIRQARLYWAGIQYGYFSGSDWQWHLPFGSSIGLGLGVEDAADAETPRYQFVTNIYQAFGLAFIALMSASIPTPTFYPQSAQNEDDVTTAKAADDIRKLIEKNHRPKALLARIAHTYWTDGKCGAYVRYVADGQRFGYENVDDLKPDYAKLTEDAYICPSCGHENEATGFGAGLYCESCGAELSDENFKNGEQVEIPTVAETRRVAKGQEVISVVGGLEFHTPPWADFQHEFPYLQWNLEVHIAKLKASYTHVAKKITASGPVSADDTFARASRVSVKQGLPATHPGDALANLVTFSRTWIRPWTFYSIDDEAVREKMLALFPKGCYIAFAGETYCEARNETMDDMWITSQAMPGDGQNRPSCGDSMIQVQEQYNTISNIEAETIEFGIPPILADAETMDFDAIEATTAEPASYYPVTIRSGEDIRTKVMQLQPSEVSNQAIERRQELMGPIGQFLTGIMPAVYGGRLEGNDTAAAYAMAREQAMGRVGLFYNELKMFYATIMLLAVNCFRQNRIADVEDISQEGGKFASKWIRQADLQGNIQTYDDPDESYPELPSQVKASVQQLIDDPVIGGLLMKEPANMRTAKSVLGLRDFVIPGEDSSNKQLREIAELMKSGPIPGAQMMDPATGQVSEGDPQPTIQIDILFDDHASELQECVRWANSDAGQSAREENPNGFENVRAHAIAHKQALQSLAAGAGGEQKGPSESINFKDLPPDGQAQMAGQAGIKLDPAALAAKQEQDKAEKAAQAQQKLGQVNKTDAQNS